MKQLFLTSSSDIVMSDIVKRLDKDPETYKIAFIDTASEVEDGDHWWVRAERAELVKSGFIDIEDFSITGMNKEQVEDKLKDRDIIYFCGGNTFYLLDQVIKSGTDKIIKRKLNEGCIYIGSSAGSMVTGIRIDLVCSIDDKSKAPYLKSDGLGIIDAAILPHWGSDYFKDEYKSGFSNMYSRGCKIMPITDDQYIWVKDNIAQLIQVEKE